MNKTVNKAFEGKTLRSIVHLASDANGKLPTEIQIIPVGEWNTEFYGPMQVTLSHISQMVQNFKAGIRKAVPIDVDHDGGKAAGWVKDLIDKGADGLWAVVKWNKYGEELLGEEIYKLFSPEWAFDYIDPAHGTRHGAVLIAGSLTNRPLFKELPFLVASDNMGKKASDLTNNKTIVILLGEEQNTSTNTMNVADILKKPKAERSEEEVKFLTDNSASLTDEQKTQLDEEAKPTPPSDEKTQEEKDAEAAQAKAQADKDAAAEAQAKADADAEAAKNDTNEAGDKTVSIKASELEAYKKLETEHKKAQEQLRHDATEKEINEKFLTAKEGARILPVMKASVLEFALKCNDEQKKAFYSILEALPATKLAGEQGDSSRSDLLTAAEKINNLVKEAVKADDKLSTTQAYKKVLAENKELSLQYEQELKSK